MKTALLIFSLISGLATTVSGATLFTEDFSSFTGAGFTPSPSAGQLDSDVFNATGFGGTLGFGGTQTSGDFARGASTGGESTGGIYAFDTGLTGLGVGWGVQPGGSDFTPGTFQVRFTYGGAVDLSDFTVSFDVAVLNNEGRENTFALTEVDIDGSKPFSGSLGLTSPAAADALGWGKTSFSTGAVTATVDPGSVFILTFTGDDEPAGSGSRDEFALDNIVVTATAVPEPAALSLIPIGAAILLRRWGKDAETA